MKFAPGYYVGPFLNSFSNLEKLYCYTFSFINTVMANYYGMMTSSALILVLQAIIPRPNLHAYLPINLPLIVPSFPPIKDPSDFCDVF
jgi:hypothetical protein